MVHLPEATSEALTAAKDETFVRELIAELRHTALSEALRKDQIRFVGVIYKNEFGKRRIK